jgi:hypothetical protein
MAGMRCAKILMLRRLRKTEPHLNRSASFSQVA